MQESLLSLCSLEKLPMASETELDTLKDALRKSLVFPPLSTASEWPSLLWVNQGWTETFLLVEKLSWRLQVHSVPKPSLLPPGLCSCTDLELKHQLGLTSQVGEGPRKDGTWLVLMP